MNEMTSWDCKRCGHIATTKSNLLQHLRRKKPCNCIIQDIDVSVYIEELLKREIDGKTYDCDWCGKQYTCWQNRSRHKKTCKKKPSDTINESDEIKIMKSKIDELERIIKESRGTTHYTMNNTNNGTINNYIINGLGKEDISYLINNQVFKDNLIKKINSMRHDKYGPVMNILEHKHFHPDYISNQNIRKSNKKDNFLDVYDGAVWKRMYKDDVLNEVFENLHAQITNVIEEALYDNKTKATIIDFFMQEVGEPLGWEVWTGNYEYTPQLEEKVKISLRKRIYSLACDRIYEWSKNQHEQHVNKPVAS